MRKRLKKFITTRISEATEIQEEIEENYLRSEQSISSKTALEPPKKTKRGAAKKKIDKTSDAMVNLATKLQVDHFKKVFSNGLDSSRQVIILRKDTTFLILKDMFQQFHCHLQFKLTQNKS